MLESQHNIVWKQFAQDQQIHSLLGIWSSAGAAHDRHVKPASVQQELDEQWDFHRDAAVTI